MRHWLIAVLPISIILACGVVVACGEPGVDDLREGEFITVTDDLTGRQFRCLYVDGEYASDMLCYDFGPTVDAP